MFFVSTVAAFSSAVFPTRLGVRCLENPSSAVVRWWWRMGGGGGEGGMKQSVSFLEPHRLSGEQHPPPLRSSERACRRGGKKKKKGCVRRDAESITATAPQTGAPCLQVLIHLHSEVTRRRESRRAVFLYLLNKILNAAPPSSSSSRAPSPTIQFFRFNQRLRKPRPFPQRWLVRSACHYTVTLQMEQGIRVIKTKMQGHNS